MGHIDKRQLTALALVVFGTSAGAQNALESDTIQLAQAEDASVEQYDRILRETAGLEVYNSLLQRQIEAQRTEITNYQAALQVVPELERQLPPLLIRMVEQLDEFVQRDIPFLREERQERVAQLQLLVERSDVDDAEKFRRILEAWQIEAEYGGAYTSYPGELEIDGMERPVDFLQIGRIGLLYQTRDNDELTGAWDARNGGWVPLGSEFRNAVNQALRMAQNQVAPDLVLLPLSPPE